MMRPANHISTRTQAGFTLIELLVALVVAIILVTIVYAMYIRGAKTYRVQNMSLEMQAQARFALEHLRRDVSNAGFNATINTNIDPNMCQKPTTSLRAISLSESTAGLTPLTENPFVKPLALTLLGDYAGDGQVFFTSSVVGTTVTLQDSFKTEITQAQFEEIFAANNNRFLRIVDKDQYELMIPITGNSYENGTVTLSSSPPVRSKAQSCGIQGFGEGLEVNSAQFIRYRLAQDTRPSAKPGKWDLIREEVKVDGKTAVADTMLIIAEYVVDLDAYDFAFDSDSTGLRPKITFTPFSTDVLDSSGTGSLGSTQSARPQDLRLLTLKMTVRSGDEDPELRHNPRQAAKAPIRTFDPEPKLEGSCRTITLTSRVLLQTLAVRNVKAGI